MNRNIMCVIAKTNYTLEPLQKTTNSNGFLTLDLVDNNLETFFNSLPLYYFQKAFPTASSPYLQRVYKIKLSDETYLQSMFERNEIEYVELVENDNRLLYTPNDFDGIPDADPSTQLDLIKARQAWNITQGDPNIIVGIVDTFFDTTHEDLTNQIIQNNDINPCSGNLGYCDHGTRVAGIVAAQTDNDKGISSIGFKTKLITFANGTSTNEVLLLLQVPGVRVINISWLSGCNYSPIHAAVYQEIWENGVVVVCGAGNGLNGTSCGNGHDYLYPASYDHTISVTSVGHVYPVGTNDPIVGERDWKDVHEKYIGDPNSSHTHNDKVDISAPGYHMTTTTVLEGIPNDYLNYANGTSYASPTVAGVVALMLAVNPSLTPDQVKNILKNTADDIYQIPENTPYIGLLGTGRVNAYRAVLEAECLLNPNPELDLIVRNSEADDGAEPDTNTEYFWMSNDIWVRNQNDGHYVQKHQNPEYDPNNPNYVYVRVTNRSCVTSSGNDVLKLYWAKANTALYWDDFWTGSVFMNGVSMGDEVGSLNIPILEPGQEAIIEFEWDVPNPEEYVGINDNPWHFCLLSRIESVDDPMTYPEGQAITPNVQNNNNIAWKNTTVVDIYPNTPSLIGGVIAISNPFSETRSFNLQFQVPEEEIGNHIYDEAEVSIEMDAVIYTAWSESGYLGQHFELSDEENKVIVTGNDMRLNNIILGPNEIGTVYVKFNFLTSEVTDKENFVLYAIQRDGVTDEVMGGETYEINKLPIPLFDAHAGNDKKINKEETITLSASIINRNAVYNWYGSEGNLIYSGTNLTVSPEITTKYKLEVISEMDGFKDYDDVEVRVNPYILKSIIPNPASNSVVVNYDATDASSAYLMIVNSVTGNSNNYILDVESTELVLDISAYPYGLYSVILVCNGEIVASKNLAKQ